MSGFPVDAQGRSRRFQTDKEAREVIDGLRRRHRRHRGRHPPAAQPRHPGQGPRPDHRRRGAALRRRAQGADEAAAHLASTCCRCRATPIPRTLEMAITGIREMSTITTPPEERHPVLTYVGAYEDRQVVAADPPRAAARGPGLLHPQPGAVDREGRRADPRAGARGAGRDRARPDGGAPARAGDARLLGEALRRARLHDDRRVGPRRLQRQHDDHRALRHPRPLPAAPAARPGRPVPRAGLRLLPLPGRRSRSPRPPTSGWPRWPSTPTSAAAWRSR